MKFQRLKKYYLREQMKAIKKELGEDEGTVEVKELEDKIKAAKMPEESEKIAMKELDRLSRIPTQSPEYNVSRTYIEWLADLPWSDATEDRIDLKEALKILDEDHYGLDKVKQRIIEYLAVRNLKQKKDPEGKVRGAILCFGGPPGVGKHHLGSQLQGRWAGNLLDYLWVELEMKLRCVDIREPILVHYLAE